MYIIFFNILSLQPVFKDEFYVKFAGVLRKKLLTVKMALISFMITPSNVCRKEV
jgi:hypothetical protein